MPWGRVPTWVRKLLALENPPYTLLVRRFERSGTEDYVNTTDLVSSTVASYACWYAPQGGILETLSPAGVEEERRGVLLVPLTGSFEEFKQQLSKKDGDIFHVCYWVSGTREEPLEPQGIEWDSVKQVAIVRIEKSSLGR
ncbi:MAG: hypothetical protein QXI19_15170 [Candidatus Caldarchaeum sp.]